MRIRKLELAAALLAGSMVLIVMSLVVVSAFSRPPQTVHGTRRATLEAPPSAQAPSHVHGPGGTGASAVVTVTRSAFHYVTDQPATVEPSQQVEVVPTVSGHVGRLSVDLGAAVMRGDDLAEIEAPERKLELAKAEAVVRQARARNATARSDVLVADSAVASARARVESAQVAWNAAEVGQDYRRRQHARIMELVAKGAIDPRVRQEEDDRLRAKEAEVNVTKTQIAVANADLEIAHARLQAARTRMEEIEEGLRIAEADRDQARLHVDSLRIRSPIDGIVTRRYVDVGAFVRAAESGGSTPIVAVVRTRAVRIVTRVPDREVSLVDVGDPAAFRADALPGRDYKGRVSRIAVAEDPSDRTMRVEIDLENADGALRPGQHGRVEILLEFQPDAIAISSLALGRSADGSRFCFRVVDGHAVLTQVTLREDDGERALVADGLSEGDLVVASARDVRDGQEIQPAHGDLCTTIVPAARQTR